MNRKRVNKIQKKIEEPEEDHSDSNVSEDVEDEEMEANSDDDLVENEQDEPEAGPSGLTNDEDSKKKKKRGIIYISSIPKYMNVTILREMLSQYAKVGRIFLQPGKLTAEEENRKKKKRRLARHFTEGWVEFDSKRAAKRVAAQLNNSPIATRKSSKFYDISWIMKYLPRFKWIHLSERLTYERAVHRQKLQTEISQARKEAHFFQENLDKSAKFQRQKKKQKKASEFVESKA